MAAVDPHEFDGRELARIFVTTKMREAREAEEVLTRRGVSYFVLAEPFGRTLFGSPRNGAFFYVLAEQADYCADVLRSAGFELGLIPSDSPDFREDPRGS